VPTFDRTVLGGVEGTLRGAYVLADTEGTPDVLLIATGSEVQLAVGARDILAAEGIKARVVSMPCREWFCDQDVAYRQSVIPPAVKARVTVEAGIAMCWNDVLGDAGRAVSIEHFGESADGDYLFEKYGFTADNVAAKARESIEAAK
jgi:transketolase